MLIKYNKLFGLIRLFLGILFIAYPVNEYLKVSNGHSGEEGKWLFAILFFLLYSLSSVKNGVRELRAELPAFNLLRFFEVTMNGFLSLYIIIFAIAANFSPAGKTLLLFLAFVMILGMIRDMRILSLQYFEKKRKNDRN